MSAKIKTLSDFLSLLERVKEVKAGQFTALCPSHHDTTPSLSIKEADDGRILLKCFAGCTNPDILKKLNLSPGDLFPAAKRAGRKERQIDIIYHYTDAKGKPFEVVRTKPKGFFQRQPDGLGGYSNNLRGIVLTLYHQEKLKQAIDSGIPIYFVEGEKDADRLWSLGLVATTNPMGAGKWRSGYSEALRGADLVIIPDNDSPGRIHANQVAKACFGLASRVRILEIPSEHEDASGWLNHGGTVEQLEQLLVQVPKYEPPPEPISEGEPGELAAITGFNLTDLGNAERLAAYYGKDLHYCYERKRWLVWNGRVWEWDMGAQITAMAKLTVRSIYHEAGDESEEKRRKEIAGHASKSESDHRIQAMVSLAQSEALVPIKVTELDNNPWLFNCLNGTIDLASGGLLPHNKGDLLTVISPVEYRPEAECPRWLSFLDRVTGEDQDLAGYLQRAVGYSLTGNTNDQVVFFLYGLGNNGKSTFVNTIRKVLARYSYKLDVDDIMVKDRRLGGGPKEGLAELKGKRFVLAGEVEEGRRLAVSLIKDMTGGETITADRKYEHIIEYQPTHKLWLMGNHKPVIPDTTLAMWRRLKLVPFTVTIPDDEINLGFAGTLEPELAGILTWAVQGCLDWQRNGLEEPEAVTTATKSYRYEEDILGDFIEDRCILERLASVVKADLKADYHQWCQDNNMDPVTQRTFKTRLIEKGITEYKGTGGQRFWRGIRIRTAQDPETKSGKTPDPAKLSGKRWRNLQESRLAKGETEKLSGKTATNATNATIATDATPEDTPPFPAHPCYTCGSKDYYLTHDNRWMCPRCHPKPKEEESS